MSIIDEALKKLGNESSPKEANTSPKQMPMPDLGFVVGSRKRRPLSLLLAIALAGAGLLVYLLLANWHGTATRNTNIETSSAASVAGSELAGPPPVWYQDGWSEVKTEKWAEAFAHWESGIRGLPNDRMVIISNTYANMNSFSSALKQQVKTFPAIGVRQQVGGKMLYRVIIFPYGGGTSQTLPKVKHLFSHAKLVNVFAVRERLHALAPVAAKPAQETAPIASQKTGAEQKLPGEKLASLNKVATETVAPAKTEGDWETRSATVRDLLQAENYPEVGKNAQSLAHDFPERWEPWFWLGTAQLAQGQMSASESALEHASKLNPKVAQIWVQRAIVAQERGDHAAAVKLLNEAHELSPKSPQIYLNLGYSNDALGLTEEANKNYLRFLSLTEGDSTYALQRKSIMQRLESRH